VTKAAKKRGKEIERGRWMRRGGLKKVGHGGQRENEVERKKKKKTRRRSKNGDGIRRIYGGEKL